MSIQETLAWQPGTTEETPLPPLVDPHELAGGEDLFLRYYQKLGPVFRVPRRHKMLTVLAGPEVNVFMARYEDEFFSTREQWEDFDAVLGSKIAGARDGQANRQRRAQSSKSYSRARVLDQLPQMMEITREFSRWQAGESFPVRPTMQRLIAEQLGRLLVGFGPGDYLPDLITYLDTAIMTSLGLEDERHEWTPEAEDALQHAKIRTYELAGAIVQAHLKHPMPNGKPDMIDEALAEAAKNPGPNAQRRAGGAAIGPFLAGLDTVANTCSFMIYALLDNPAVLKRVLDEVDAVFAGGPLTWELLKNMTALHGAAMETLRRYPVAGGHMAKVAKPLTLAGYRLEPGDDIYIAMTVPHFLPELYPDPEKFDIDRFHAPRNEHRQRGAYAPFGLGDHTCLGAGIAEVQLMVTIATIFHDYTLELDPPSYTLTIEYAPTPAPGKDFHVKAIAKRDGA
ncbi:MAG TPA: cytochrome P450 [Ktedonobacteraceae bacterium]